MAVERPIHLPVEIALAGDEFAEDVERDFRDRLVAAVESRGTGEVGGFGSGSGGTDMSVLVRDEQVGREQLAALIRDLAPGASCTIEVPSDEEGESTEPGAAPDRC